MLIRTCRLSLRPGGAEDAVSVAQAIAHDVVTHRLEHVPSPYTLADAAAWLARPHEAGSATLLVLDHEEADARVVGAVSLLPRDGDLMLGYWYTPSVWGRGYATEAGRAAIELARRVLGATRLTSRYKVDNPASGNVLRKLGFRETGVRLSVHSLARGHAVEAIAMEADLTDLAEPPPFA